MPLKSQILALLSYLYNTRGPEVKQKRSSNLNGTYLENRLSQIGTTLPPAELGEERAAFPSPQRRTWEPVATELSH